MRFFYLVAVSVLFTSSALCQETKKERRVSGSIFELHTKAPINHAVVLILNTQNVIIAFTESDSLGSYSIKYLSASDSVNIKIKLLGYQSIEKKISTSLNTFDAYLARSNSFELKEVIVQSRKSVEVNGDTLDYQVERFKNGTEKNIIDVLAKLPGIEVAGNKIKFQGKEIEAILLDGDNLTGRDYSLIPKSVSADFLSGIQVIKKFSKKSLLNDVTKESEDVAINLKLKKSSAVFGQADMAAGAGDELKYDVKLQLLTYLKRSKSVAIGNVENLGNDIEIGDIEKIMNEADNFNGTIQSNEIVNLSEVVFPLLPDIYNNFQEAQAFSNSSLIKASEKLKINSITKYFKNNWKYPLNQTFNYILPGDSIFEMNQQIMQYRLPSNFSQEIKLNYTPTDNEELNCSIDLYRNTRNGNQINETSFSKSIESNALVKQGVTFSLNYIRRASSSSAREWNLVYSNYRLDENINVDFENGSTNESFLQSIFQSNQSALVRYNTYLNFKKSFFGKISLGLKYSNNSFYKDSSIPKSNDLVQFFIENDFSKRYKKYLFFLTNTMNVASLQLADRRYSYLLPKTVLGIGFEDSVFRKFQVKTKLYFDQSFRFLDNNQFYTDTIRTSFRQRAIWFANPRKPILNKALVWYTQFSKSINFDVSFEVGLEHTYNDFVTQNIFWLDNIISIYRQEGSVKTVFYAMKSSYYLPKIKTTFLFGYNHERIITPFFLENQGGVSTISNGKIDVLLTSPITKNADISIGIDYVANNNNFLQSNTAIKYYKYFASFSIRLVSSFSINTKINGFQFKYPNNTSPVFFAELFVSKRIAKKDLYIELNGHNLLNVSKLFFQENEPSLSKSTIYPIQPRFFTAKVIFKIS